MIETKTKRSTLYLLRELQLKKTKHIQEYFINMSKIMFLLKETNNKEDFFNTLNIFLKEEFSINDYFIFLKNNNNEIIELYKKNELEMNKKNDLFFEIGLLKNIIEINIKLTEDNSLIITNKINEIYSFFENISYILKEYMFLKEKDEI